MYLQVVLKNSIVDDIANNPDYEDEVKNHQEKYPTDPLPIPFDDPDPQLMMGYDQTYKYHVQIYRDAFSNGEEGPKTDSRVIVDLRCLTKHDIDFENCVVFPQEFKDPVTNEWYPSVTDEYGMPQPTVCWERNFFRVTFAAHGETNSSKFEGLLPMANAMTGLCAWLALSSRGLLKPFTSMMEYMTKVALSIGPFLPGSYPQFLVGQNFPKSSPDHKIDC